MASRTLSPRRLRLGAAALLAAVAGALAATALLRPPPPPPHEEVAPVLEESATRRSAREVEAPLPSPRPAPRVAEAPPPSRPPTLASASARPASSPAPSSSPASGDVHAGPGETVRVTGLRVRGLRAEGTITLPPGPVSVEGDISVGPSGALEATATALVLEGRDQLLEGKVEVGALVMRGGGVKRLRGAFATGDGENTTPGEAQLVVEAGTTLLIERGTKWFTPRPYGFRIAGAVIVDGGVFQCTFSNGTGTEWERSWLPGSTLEVRNGGSFIGSGDADFGGARITLRDGVIAIDDDIWSTGEALTIEGGLFRNRSSGGMFRLTGAVSMSGGTLEAGQWFERGLFIDPAARVFCTGGEVVIGGGAAADPGGITVGASAVLPDLTVKASTGVSSRSTRGATLRVGGKLTIAASQRFEARGFPVQASFTPGPEQGELVP